jgi:hypothetical protein
MYNTKFDSLKSAMELNKLTEKELVVLLQRNFDNLNYREGYNKKKNLLIKSLLKGQKLSEYKG